MKNKVVFASAGNGKTYDLCRQAIELAKTANKEILMISYTNEGKNSIENEYRKQNSGIIDKKVVIKTWYSFILSEFIKPYQCKLSLNFKHFKDEYEFKFPPNHIKSIAFYSDEKPQKWYNGGHVQYYLNGAKDLYKDNVTALAIKCLNDSGRAVIKRLEDIYSHIFIDELQDYAGWDLEIFKSLFYSNINVICVGDYKQATFRTNNSSKNKKFRDDKIRVFFKELEKVNLCEISYSNETRRFNKEICSFINRIFNEEESNVIPNKKLKNNEEENTGIYIIENKYMKEYCDYYNPTILRYDRRSKINFGHSCNVLNYGNSKGCTFDRVVIIPVSTVLPFIIQQAEISSKQTRSKFYVACTRARHSVVFVVDQFISSDLYNETSLNLNGVAIPALKYPCMN